MSQFFAIPTPPPVSVSLTADDNNTLSGSSFNILGQKAGTIPTMQTRISGGDFYIENNAFETAYIVDASTTPGLKGTFQTIQSAIDQAILDGYITGSGKNAAVIYIRPGYYNENINIGTGEVCLTSSQITQATEGVKITGTITIPSTATCTIQNIRVESGGTSIIIQDGSHTAFYNLLTDTISISGDFTNSYFENCYIVTVDTDATALTYSNPVFYDCLIYYVNFINPTNAIQVDFRYCEITELNVYEQTSCNIFFSTVISLNISISGYANAYFSNIGVAAGDSITESTFIYCYFNDEPQGPYSMNSCTCDNSWNFANSTTYKLTPTIQGNIFLTRNTATDTNVNTYDYYIGVTDTSSARTITLPASPKYNQTFVIKDESGGATTHNITISGNGKNIDGAATKVISTNYGAYTIKAATDGTAYFVVSKV